MADDDLDWGNPPPPGNSQAGKPASVAGQDLDWGNPAPSVKPAAAGAPPSPVFSGSFLPLTRYSDGSVGFDSNAGMVGTAKRAFMLPGDVATGKVDPNSPEAIRRSMDLASMAAPDAAVMTAKKLVASPSEARLRAAEDMGYDAARNMDVRYSVPHVAEMARQKQQELYNNGFLPSIVPGTHKILDDLQSAPDGATDVPLVAIEAARRGLGRLRAIQTNPSEGAAASSAQKAIDEFVTNPTPESVVSGPAAAAAKVLTDARGNSAAAFRSERVNKGEGAAELSAAAAGSGQNLGNSIRQRAKAILLNPKLSQGYNPEELAALTDVVKGTPVSNSLRIAGNILGGGGGLGSQVAGAITGAAASAATGSFWGTAAGVIPPIVGNLAKRGDNYLTSQRLNAADELIRRRSPLYREQKKAAPVVSSNPGARVAGVRGAGVITNEAPPMTPDEAAQYVKQHQGDTFASGGAVKRKSHEELVSRLMGASEKAKASTKRDTKNLLAVPDNTVARALAIAQKSI